MDNTKTVIIPMRTAICAARHFFYLHKGVCLTMESEKPFGCDWAWGLACAECSESHKCRLDWIETMAPIFDATGIHPQIASSPKRPNPSQL